MPDPLLQLDINYILQEMEEVYPPVNPTPESTANQIMYRAGQRSVVEWLRQRITQD